MSFIQIEQQKEYFFKSYIAIENIANIGHCIAVVKSIQAAKRYTIF